MKITEIKELFDLNESGDVKIDEFSENVTVGGWIRSIRDSKTFGFIVISDGTCFKTLQIVYDESLSNFKEISKLNVGAVFRALYNIIKP